MILDNHLDVPADPDAVFALINDVERVASCLPGAVLDGQEGDTYLGRVTFKVGPIKAAYAGKIRFTEVAGDERRLRLSARGADSHGNGDAEADVTLTVSPAGDGTALDLHTDLVVRGKIAQFGKGAITTVSGRLLDQFARNIAAQLEAPAGGPAPTEGSAPAPGPNGDSDRAAGPTGRSTPAPGPNGDSGRAAGPTGGSAPGAPAPAGAPAAARAGAAATGSDDALHGLAMLLPPNAGRYAVAAAALAVAFFQGWLLGRVRTQDILIKELRRGR